MDGSQQYPGAVPAGASHAGDGHGTVLSYIVGFLLSVILPVIPFGLVMSGALPAHTAVMICVGLGVVQIVVHLIYFLHMNTSSSQSWNMAALVFTVVVVAILVAGSLWVMNNMNANMMPGMMPTE
jgi:cytochrome o ubiquinol oxidase operon protein cyoD